jgi:hypothetical protein
MYVCLHIRVYMYVCMYAPKIVCMYVYTYVSIPHWGPWLGSLAGVPGWGPWLGVPWLGSPGSPGGPLAGVPGWGPWGPPGSSSEPQGRRPGQTRGVTTILGVCPQIPLGCPLLCPLMCPLIFPDVPANFSKHFDLFLYSFGISGIGAWVPKGLPPPPPTATLVAGSRPISGHAGGISGHKLMVT